MSHATHANAALTPRARLRLGQLVIDCRPRLADRPGRGTLRRVLEDGQQVGAAVPA